MERRKLPVLVLALFIFPVCASAQNPSAMRWLFDAEFGSQAELGFKPPSTGFGVSIEQPLGQRFELDAGVHYSPDRKYITNDGNSFAVSGGGIFWLNQRVGASGTLERDWLWTSQFDETALSPSPGVVIRNTLAGPGRFTAGYVLPTGCVWATRANPCLIQSKRTQGIQLGQEFQARSHFRYGINGGLYHFCDQSNENEPSIPRHCHFARTLMLFVRIEFPAQNPDTPY